MKNKMQLIIKIVSFLIILLVLVNQAGKAVIPKWYDEWNNTAVIDDFYSQPKNTIDVLAVGSSQVIKGFSALELYRNYGISAYALGTEQQSIQASYTWMKESLKTQKNQKVILFETKMLFEDTPEEQNRKSFDNMKFSLNKLQAIVNQTIIEEKSFTNFIGYLFPLTRFHSRWNDLEYIDFTKQGDRVPNYRGYSLSNERSGLTTYEFLDESIEEEKEITESRLKYFSKIVKLCEQNNIKLILFKVPDLDWDTGRYNAVCKLAEENNLEYIDFGTEKYGTAINFNYSEDTEINNHFNIHGAEKITNYLGQVITENCKIEDKRNLEGYEFLKEELAIYDYDIQNKKLANIFEPSKYIEALKSENFTVVMVKNNVVIDESDSCKNLINMLGLDFEKVKESNYCAIFENGQKKLEESGTDIIKVETVLDNTRQLVVSTEGSGSILVDGVEYSNKNPGFDLLVYNNKNHQFVESSYIGYKDGVTNVGR